MHRYGPTHRAVVPSGEVRGNHVINQGKLLAYVDMIMYEHTPYNYLF